MHDWSMTRSIFGSLKVDPDNRQDRKSGEVITYKLSPEELEKYRNVGKPYRPPSMAGVKEMKRIDKKESVEIMKITKTGVLELNKQGKSIEEILCIFKPFYKNCRDSIIRAKIGLYLKDNETIEVKKPKSAEVRNPKKVSKSIRFYISTGWDNRVNASRIAEVISASGGHISCEWWKHEYTDNPIHLGQAGDEEMEAVRNCDVFVCMMPGMEGTHAELGAAVVLRKSVILYMPETNKRPVPFYHCKGVRIITGDALNLVTEALRIKSELYRGVVNA